MMNLLKQFSTQVKEFNAKRNGIVFWTVIAEIIMLLYSYDLYQKGHINVSMIVVATAIGLACLVAYKIAKYSAEIAGYTKEVADLFDGKSTQLTPSQTLANYAEERAPSVLYVSNDKVYEIPRLQLDEWAKANPELREKLKKIVNAGSLRATMNFHLLPEDRQALGMHILMDIGQEVFDTVYPDVINHAIQQMGKDAFEKEYVVIGLKRKDVEDNPRKLFIEGDLK